MGLKAKLAVEDTNPRHCCKGYMEWRAVGCLWGLSQRPEKQESTKLWDRSFKESDTLQPKSTQVDCHQRCCEVACLWLLYSPAFSLFSGHSESLTQTWASSWLWWAVLSSHTQLSWQEEGNPTVRGCSQYHGCKWVEHAPCRCKGSGLADMLALECWLSLLLDTWI